MYRYRSLPVIVLLIGLSLWFAGCSSSGQEPAIEYTPSTAVIFGAPEGLTNKTNPMITIGGDGVVSYRYKLDAREYSAEIPSSEHIGFSADVTLKGLKLTAGSKTLQNVLDYQSNFIESVSFENVTIETPLVFLLNKKRIFLKNDNVLSLEGTNLGQLDVHMHASPTVPATGLTQSLSTSPQSITYNLHTEFPETDYIRIINRSRDMASFKMNLNNKLFIGEDDLLADIHTMVAEYPDEPIQRKVWRFIRDNRYHWIPLSGGGWIGSSPALFFNSIGFGFCGDSAELFCQIMALLGYQTRYWALYGHVVSEVLINGRWEMYDPDLQVYYHNRRGEIAGVEELAADPDLITKPVIVVSGAVGVPGDTSGAYCQRVADIYSNEVKDDNLVFSWYYDYTVGDYSLKLDLPPGGVLEFPSIFAAPMHTIHNSYFYEAPFYTNARIIVPRGWTGTLRTPFVIESIGYDGAHTLSVEAKDRLGNWQETPTVASWTTDSWAPITTATQRTSGGPITLTSNEQATIYYTLLESEYPSTSSTIYTVPLTISSTDSLKFFGIDAAGNAETVKRYDATTGAMNEIHPSPPPATGVTLTMDKSSPQEQGTMVTFTAEASGGSGIYEYYFIFQDPTDQWIMGQEYSAYPQWTWHTTGEVCGEYSIQVWARSAGSDEDYDVYASLGFTLNPSPRVESTAAVSAEPTGTRPVHPPAHGDATTSHAARYVHPSVSPFESGMQHWRRPYRSYDIHEPGRQ